MQQRRSDRYDSIAAVDRLFRDVIDPERSHQLPVVIFLCKAEAASSK